MGFVYDSGRKMPLELVPDRKRGLAAKGFELFDARARDTARTRAAAAEKVADDVARRLRDKLGARTYAALLTAQADERAAFARSLELPQGLGVDRAKARQGFRRRMAAATRRLAIDPKVINDILASGYKKLDAALGPRSPHAVPGLNLADNLRQWMDLSPLHQHPLDIGVRPPFDGVDVDAFQVFGPSFPLWNHRADNLQSSNFRIGGDYSLYNTQGFFGNTVTLDCDDAGSFDFAQSIVDTEHIFIYTAPRSGRIEVIVDAINFFSRNELRFSDEWGWSDHWTQQYHYFTLMPYHPSFPGRSLCSMVQFYKEGEDGTFSERPLAVGAHYYSHFLTEGFVAAGDTFFVGIGIRSFDRSRANDVEVHSKSNFQWLVRSAEIRVVA